MAALHVISTRRSRRYKVIMPISLIGDHEGERFVIPASTLDISMGGLRIEASVRLRLGEIVHVQFQQDPTGFRRFQVVWTKPAGALRPSQAGLISLKSAPKTFLELIPSSSIEPMINAA